MNTPPFNKPVKRRGALSDLPVAQQQQLKVWLNTDMTYREIMGFVKKEFGVSLNSVSPLKQFRKRMRVEELQERPICPPCIPREIWECSITKLKEVLYDPATSVERRVRVSAFLLQLTRLTLDANRFKTKGRAAKGSKARAASAKREPEENPLDDQEKIDEARRQVFGHVAE